MSKKTKIIIAVLAILIIAILIIGVVFLRNQKTDNTDNEKEKSNTTQKEVSETSNLKAESAEDLSKIIDKIYNGLEIELPALQTQVLELSEEITSASFTGLESDEDLEYVVVSEPLMTAQPYSLVLVKVKDGVNADEIAKKMNENIDLRKWLCVSAEKAYTTSSGNIVCLVMANADTAKTIYEKFKSLAGTIRQEYEKEEEAVELPPDMY